MPPSTSPCASWRGDGGGGADLLDDDLAVLVDGAVVDHAHYGHAQVAADAEGDAEADAAQHGDDVAARQTEAVALAQGRLLLGGLAGPPVLGQLDHLARVLLLLHYPATGAGGDAASGRASCRMNMTRVAQNKHFKSTKL